ncbi:Hypothetical protein D9617_5g071370 [Elsinoe fawcettii]|nr:Hypothetical protein D9617_5g071370 [Elsinoe fawcettii]
MSLRRRTITVLVACILYLAYRLSSSEGSWHSLQRLGGEGTKVVIPDWRSSLPSAAPWKDVFPPGTTKTDGSEYTRTIVVASKKGAKVQWVDNELSDLLVPNGSFEKAIYIADDRFAPLHPPRNKGNEVTVYLTYIIDHYDSLPDVAIFTHSDRFTWHNNELMDNDLAGMIRYLIPEKVVKEGYVNLRCSWVPGCPDWLLLNESPRDNIQKHEEAAIPKHWKELFPMDEMPSVLSQACCAQFALSRDRIRQIPRERYLYLRSWIIRTPIEDYRSGRMFEYLWQYIFTGNGSVCPAMHLCYCETYGICFGGEKEFNKWYELRYRKAELESKIQKLQGQPSNDEVEKTLAEDRQRVKLDDAAGVEEMELRVAGLQEEMRTLRDEAFLRGRSAEVRAREASLG